MSDHGSRLLYRIPEVSECLGLSRTKIYELMWKGELRSVKIGRAIRIPRTALEEFTRKLEESHDEG